MNTAILNPILAILLVISLGNCNSFTAATSDKYKTLSAKIGDSNGNPIEGALFYAEAYTHKSGAFDFTYGYAEANGKTMTSSNMPLTIKWRNNARLAIAAFAPNYKPVVVYDQLVPIEANGIELTLQKLPGPGLRWEPRVAQLSFPFENNPDLARRISAPGQKALRDAFFDAYEPLRNKEETALPREWNKMKFLEKIITNSE